jgi:hypothetical protein
MEHLDPIFVKLSSVEKRSFSKRFGNISIVTRLASANLKFFIKKC